MIPTFAYHDALVFTAIIAVYALVVIIASAYIQKNITHFHHYMVALIIAPTLVIPLWFYAQRPDDLFAATFWIIVIIVLSSFIIDVEDFLEAHKSYKKRRKEKRTKK